MRIIYWWWLSAFIFCLFLTYPEVAGGEESVRVYITGSKAGKVRFYTADPTHEIPVYVDGARVYFYPPALVFKGPGCEGRTMIPLRVLAEFLGARVGWEEDTRSITVTRGEDEIRLIANEFTAFRNGRPFSLEIPPVLINNRTYAPLRFFSEGLGYMVKWDDASGSVFINSSGNQLRVEPQSIYSRFREPFIREAINYGRAYRYAGLTSFFREWTVRAGKEADAPVARLETAFSALAQMARTAAKTNRSLTEKGIEKILTEHRDKLIFYLSFNRKKSEAPVKYRAYLEQRDNRIVPVGQRTEEEFISGNRHRVKIRLEFSSRRIDTASSVKLVVLSSQGEKFTFDFDLGKIR
ncbi:copper amine oxidase N-terminal domain-containing protein [Calderihabitans maritimus]|uniref:Copper amine oxidase-like N-terminal domain-containing protein n=1 Tax=Calderihabitans maritimus TaxID=1246530 RepID=A0A1Z5HUN5_9FIRM|nr:copper amine oxidase N-terminal domain-containing protein [Calderihabitans maritimus]GAW93249.1 hypothetical protein KKC1_23880 [Calderihabitans maritimus]